MKLQFGLGPGHNLSHASEQVNERVTQLVSERKYARLSGWALKDEELKKRLAKVSFARLWEHFRVLEHGMQIWLFFVLGFSFQDGTMSRDIATGHEQVIEQVDP